MGELRRRIEELIKIERPPHPPFLLEHPIYLMNVEALKTGLQKIIEEMRQEFPDEQKKIRELGYLRIQDIPDKDYVILCLYSDILEWREKWLK